MKDVERLISLGKLTPFDVLPRASAGTPNAIKGREGNGMDGKGKGREREGRGGRLCQIKWSRIKIGTQKQTSKKKIWMDGG